MITLTPPITFRGWSMNTDKMYSPRQYQYSAPSTINMQSTGLLDANKQEVFAGDIIMPISGLPSTKEDNSYLIAFKEGCFVVIPITTRSTVRYIHPLRALVSEGNTIPHFEVIGNIFETSNLVPEDVKEMLFNAE